MLSLLICLASTAPWTFHDQAERDGRSMFAFKTVELATQPVKPLDKSVKPLTGARYGLVTVGSPANSHCLLWNDETGSLWIDLNGDDRFTPDEQWQLGATTLALPVSLKHGNVTVKRTLLIKRRGTGIATALRGYMEGTIDLGGKSTAALLLDGNTDGAFDGVGHDRLWLDLDHDSRFDPITEQFTLGTPITHAGTIYLVQSDAAAQQVVARPRPTATGKVRVQLGKYDPARITMLSAHLISEWGELIEIVSGKVMQPLPVGKYRLSSLAFTLMDDDQRPCTVQMHSYQRHEVVVTEKQEQTVDLLGTLHMSIEAALETQPGERLSVSPNIISTTGLYMSNCRWRGEEVRARLLLTGADHQVLDEASTGFA